MTRSTNMEHVEVLRDLSEVCRAAIKAGDWKVDGACDPDAALRRADAAITSLSAPQPAAVDGADAKDAEIEVLRVRADAMAGEAIKHEARAERLAEALRAVVADMREWGEPAKGAHVERIQRRLDDALRDHDQEVGNG